MGEVDFSDFPEIVFSVYHGARVSRDFRVNFRESFPPKEPKAF